MKKMYYDCPIIAPYMAKYFGMKFADRAGYSVSANPAMWYMAERHYTAESLYIHPDSLPILDVQVGDMVTNTHKGNQGRECSGLVSSMQNDGKSACITTAERHNGKRYFSESVSQLLIIQRNNMPFHMPKVEE